MTEKIINVLPDPTWSWLKLNNTVISWDEERELDLGETVLKAEAGQKALKEDLDITGEGAYSSRRVQVIAEEGSEITVVENLLAGDHLTVRTELKAGKNARITLVQLQLSKQGSMIHTDVRGYCDESGHIDIVQFFLGEGDIYSDNHVDLNGRYSGLNHDIGYIGQHRDTIDINVVANHYGRESTSEIVVSGALKDASQKTFRGTIDFKTGASDSIGEERESVLLLGDDVVNRTVPVILCAEENVIGNHGGTIGELDEETLFYFESRGIGRELAENIMARAGIERLLRLVKDEKIAGRVAEKLEEVLE